MPSQPKNKNLKYLEQRLADGYERIEQALAQGDDVEAWESFWIELLKEYEEMFQGMPEVE